MIQSMKFKKLFHIAKIGFEEQHLERIDQLKLIQRLMRKEYDACKDPYKGSVLGKKIDNQDVGHKAKSCINCKQ